jgi:outer membrane protein assembly factor BamD (BamD/ComL family)
LLVLLNGILGAQEIFVWETPESRIAASLDTPHPNYRVLTAEAVKKYQNNDFAEACEIADRLNREYMDEPASRRKAIELFCRSFEALLLFQSDRTPEGLRIMEHVLADPDWQMLIHSTYNYPRLVLLMTAQAYLKNGKRRQAAAMYQHLAHFYDRFEPMEKEFYLALSAR